MSPARFERAAFRLGGGRSILLSYEDVRLAIIITDLRQNCKRYFRKITDSAANRASS